MSSVSLGMTLSQLYSSRKVHCRVEFKTASSIWPSERRKMLSYPLRLTVWNHHWIPHLEMAKAEVSFNTSTEDRTLITGVFRSIKEKKKSQALGAGYHWRGGDKFWPRLSHYSPWWWGNPYSYVYVTTLHYPTSGNRPRLYSWTYYHRRTLPWLYPNIRFSQKSTCNHLSLEPTPHGYQFFAQNDDKLDGCHREAEEGSSCIGADASCDGAEAKEGGGAESGCSRAEAEGRSPWDKGGCCPHGGTSLQRPKCSEGSARYSK